MKAKVINKDSEHYGKSCQVRTVLLGRIVVLYIDGRKVDYGMSEVEFIPDCSLGAEIVSRFRDVDSPCLRNSEINKVARKAAKVWPVSIVSARRAVNAYVWGS